MLQSLHDVMNFDSEAEDANERSQNIFIYNVYDLADVFYEGKQVGCEPQLELSTDMVSGLNSTNSTSRIKQIATVPRWRAWQTTASKIYFRESGAD